MLSEKSIIELSEIAVLNLSDDLKNSIIIQQVKELCVLRNSDAPLDSLWNIMIRRIKKEAETNQNQAIHLTVLNNTRTQYEKNKG